MARFRGLALVAASVGGSNVPGDTCPAAEGPIDETSLLSLRQGPTPLLIDDPDTAKTTFQYMDVLAPTAHFAADTNVVSENCEISEWYDTRGGQRLRTRLANPSNPVLYCLRETSGFSSVALNMDGLTFAGQFGERRYFHSYGTLISGSTSKGFHATLAFIPPLSLMRFRYTEHVMLETGIIDGQNQPRAQLTVSYRAGLEVSQDRGFLCRARLRWVLAFDGEENPPLVANLCVTPGRPNIVDLTLNETEVGNETHVARVRHYRARASHRPRRRAPSSSDAGYKSDSESDSDSDDDRDEQQNAPEYRPREERVHEVYFAEANAFAFGGAVSELDSTSAPAAPFEMLEFAVYDSALTEGARNSVRRQLRAKWVLPYYVPMQLWLAADRSEGPNSSVYLDSSGQKNHFFLKDRALTHPKYEHAPHLSFPMSVLRFPNQQAELEAARPIYATGNGGSCSLQTGGLEVWFVARLSSEVPETDDQPRFVFDEGEYAGRGFGCFMKATVLSCYAINKYVRVDADMAGNWVLARFRVSFGDPGALELVMNSTLASDDFDDGTLSSGQVDTRTRGRGFTIGGQSKDSSSANRIFEGDIAEVIVTETLLEEDSASLLNQTLRSKWEL